LIFVFLRDWLYTEKAETAQADTENNAFIDDFLHGSFWGKDVL
jgi:hypothetical protein